MPGSLYTVIHPRCWATIPYAVLSPRPVPAPSGLVVKNGSKMRATVYASIPQPVSDTEITTYHPDVVCTLRASIRSS